MLLLHGHDPTGNDGVPPGLPLQPEKFHLTAGGSSDVVTEAIDEVIGAGVRGAVVLTADNAAWTTTGCR
jgi:hypothetical protein